MLLDACTFFQFVTTFNLIKFGTVYVFVVLLFNLSYFILWLIFLSYVLNIFRRSLVCLCILYQLLLSDIYMFSCGCIFSFNGNI